MKGAIDLSFSRAKRDLCTNQNRSEVSVIPAEWNLHQITPLKVMVTARTAGVRGWEPNSGGGDNMDIEKYKKRARHNIADSTLSSRVSGQRNLKEFMDHDGEPAEDDVEEWLDHMIDKHDSGNMKASTIREYFKAVRYYFEVVKREHDALEGMEKWIPSNDSDPGDYLTEEEREKLCAQISNYRDRAMAELMYYYARRPSEIIQMNLGDVDLENGTVTFPILKKEEDIRATFELLDRPRKHLEKWLTYRRKRPDFTEEIEWRNEDIEVKPLFVTSQGRISYNSFYKTIKEASDAANIQKNATPKATGRHSRATHLDWDGNQPGDISRDLLVHSPGTGTGVINKYVHERDEDMVRDTMTMEEEDDADN